jgi:uncharacterized membrane protein
MINNLKNNVRNKTWWVAVISLVLLILQSKGFDLTQYIGADWQTTLNNIFTLLALVGISVDTTNTGGVANEVVQETTTNEDNTAIETQTESTTTSINNTVTQNSAKDEQIKTLLNQLNTVINS